MRPHKFTVALGWFAQVLAQQAQQAFLLPEIDLPHEIMHSWAQYSPAYPLQPYEIPSHCKVTQVRNLSSQLQLKNDLYSKGQYCESLLPINKVQLTLVYFF